MPSSSQAATSNRPRAPSAASRSSPRTATSALFGDEPGEDEWDAPGSEFLNAPRASGRRVRSKSRKKRDEPMKPITVILYVIFFYLIWQILTRSTEIEILSHLSPSSPHHYQLSSLLPESSGSSSPYHLPYQFPQFPSPLPPSSPASSDTSPSTLRWIFGLFLYPFYILLLPLPLLLNTLHIIVSILSTLLFPLTATGRILAHIFIRTPYTWARAVGAALYPLYVFVGGMVGMGCVMGLGAGWAGKKCVEWVVGDPEKERAKEKGSSFDARQRAGDRDDREHIDERGYRTSRHSDLAYRSKHSRPTPKYAADHISSGSDTPPPHNPRTPPATIRYFNNVAPVLFAHDSVSQQGGGGASRKGKERAVSDRERGSGGRGSGREAQVIGTRRRGVRYVDE